MKVLIAEDHQIVREGIRRILEERPEIQLVNEAENERQVLDHISKTTFDLVILDIHLPGISGLEILKKIKADHPKLPVLILSMYPEEQYAVRAIRAGAAGYMTKASAGKDLIKALLQIQRGQKYITEKAAAALADALATPDDQAPHTLLSNREFTVLKMIGSGMTVGQIADELNLSVKTISSYRTHVLEKMSLKNNAELMRYAIENNLVD